MILEPISPSRRTAERAEQMRRHEIASELVMQDGRNAGFRVSALEEPFSNHGGHGVEWLMVLTPASSEALNPPDHAHAPFDSRDKALAQGRPAEDVGDTKAPDLRIQPAEFYLKKQGVTNVKALVGGYEAWASSGGPVESSRPTAAS